jgi:dihydroxyacetone kinase-like predicted kinase
MYNYRLEFILNTFSSEKDIRTALGHYGEALEVFALPPADRERGHHYKVQLSTPDPTLIFDMCAHYGRIKSVKVEEQGRN